MSTHKIHAGGVFGVVLLVSTAIESVFRVCIKSDITEMGILRANGAVLAASVGIGAVLLVLGALVGYISHEAFNRAVDESGMVEYVIREGPFRWVRHPFYLSLILIVLSLVFLLQSYAFLLGSVVLTGIVVREAQKEEAILVQAFGEAYLSYQRQTGMFVPRRRRM
jgi:protein-S-isoprenylcysteine O-methyltransferase Ste14